MYKSTSEIRQLFLDFFHSKGHKIVESSSLIPNHDPTLLFTNAGMNQFKDVFLGLDERSYKRATTAQPCIRAGGKHNDLEQVGYTTRHHTFFEMLGNFSFGDYFKHEAISFAWELLTSKKWFNLEKNKIWVTVFFSDNESYNIWSNHIGIPLKQIIRIGNKTSSKYNSDNFWKMGDTGPCGPCSEIFYDHGDHIFGGPPGSIDEHGDRYIEIWNLVFMQFNLQLDGSLVPLPKPSVDTGMGLDRITAVLQNVNSNYEIDSFQKLITAVSKITNTTDINSRSLRVISDHIRSCAFLLSYGIIPSNEGRGYVLRRIIRRAIRHGYMLGSKKAFLYKLIAPLIDIMEDAADQLIPQQNMIEQLLRTEEEQFSGILKRGLAILNTELTKLNGDTLDGNVAFRLHDTYGFPLDLTFDACRERNLKIDNVSFEHAMSAQKTRSRQLSKFYDNCHLSLNANYTTEFFGYTKYKCTGYIIALFYRGQQVNSICGSEESIVILDKTPFYGESGGQVGDQGELYARDFLFFVRDTKKFGKMLIHIGMLKHGSITIGKMVLSKVNQIRRDCIRLNHSATHLLHSTLRYILGLEVKQKGSLVNDKRLRFDFSYKEPMTFDQIRKTEDIVNAKIRENLIIKTDIIEVNTAKKHGAISLFEEQYDNLVRMITIGNFSKELCGGIHALRTGDLGLFNIISESGIAAGVRRIEAVTGEVALKNLYYNSDLVKSISKLMNSNTKNLNEKIRLLKVHASCLEKEVKNLKYEQIIRDNAQLINNVQIINGISVIVRKIDNIDSNQLRIIATNLKNQLESAVIILATIVNNRVIVVSCVTKNLTHRIKAKEIIFNLAKKIKGNGGGSSDFAQAGGTDIIALPSALASIEKMLIKNYN